MVGRGPVGTKHACLPRLLRRDSPYYRHPGARSSVGERSLHTREVAGSKPAVPIARRSLHAARRVSEDVRSVGYGEDAQCPLVAASGLGVVDGQRLAVAAGHLE